MFRIKFFVLKVNNLIKKLAKNYPEANGSNVIIPGLFAILILNCNIKGPRD